MADITYRANLASAFLPLLSEESGRTVIVKQQDQNFVQTTVSKADTDKDIGVPQVYYMHNVMPTDSGYRSVGYSTQIPGISGKVFKSVYTLVSALGEKAYLAQCSDGTLYRCDLLSGYAWTALAETFTGDITVAVTQGRCIIFFSRTAAYEYVFTATPLLPLTLTGITVTDVLGVLACKGYLIVYSEDTVAWCSLADITDFTPSLETGAGGGSVEGAKGPIRKCVAIGSSFLVFTASNTVAAVAANNTRYPFNFTELSGAGGLTNLTLCTDEADTANVFAFTTYGLQQLAANKAQPLLPQISDFLTGQRFEDFDTTTLTFSKTATTSPLKRRLELVAGRYLIISYGLSTDPLRYELVWDKWHFVLVPRGGDSFTHALVYDVVLQRLGKLKIPHVSVFAYSFFDADTADSAKKQIAFLQIDGTVKTVDFTAVDTPDSVALFGKYQYVRTRTLQLQSVEVETVDASANFALYDMPTLDGKTFLAPIAGHLAYPALESRSYSFHNTALNHSLLCIGNFRLCSLVLNFNVGGAR